MKRASKVKSVPVFLITTAKGRLGTENRCRNQKNYLISKMKKRWGQPKSNNLVHFVAEALSRNHHIGYKVLKLYQSSKKFVGGYNSHTLGEAIDSILLYNLIGKRNFQFIPEVK